MAEASPTEYQVLKQDENGLWEPLVTLEVKGGHRAAIRKATAETTEGGTFVAVPTRSWNPEPIEVETKTTVKFKTPEVVAPQSPGEAAAAAGAQTANPGRPLASAPVDDDGA